MAVLLGVEGEAGAVLRPGGVEGIRGVSTAVRLRLVGEELLYKIIIKTKSLIIYLFDIRKYLLLFILQDFNRIPVPVRSYYDIKL